MDMPVRTLLKRNHIPITDETVISDGTLLRVSDQYLIKQVFGVLRLKKNVFISEELNRANINTIQCVDYIPVGEKSDETTPVYLLMRFLPGEKLTAGQLVFSSVSIADSLGYSLARLHIRMGQLTCPFPIPHGDLTSDFDYAVRILQSTYPLVLDEVRERCSYFCRVYPSFPRQLIHRDIQLRNLLFSQGTVSAFLDLDSCEINVRSHDLIYFGLTLLHELSVEDSDQTERWKTVFSSFIRHYHQEYGLTVQERTALFPLALILQTNFLAYYLHQGYSQNVVRKHMDILIWLLRNSSFLDRIV